MMIPHPSPPPVGDAHRRVRFRFEYLRRTGKWSTKKIKEQDLIAACSRLRVVSRMSLLEFRSSSVIRMKNINKGLPPAPEELAEDVKSNLCQEFRLSQRMRVFGYLKDREFFLIWLDPNHKFAKSRR